jgi:site-specific recombinase XerD
LSTCSANGLKHRKELLNSDSLPALFISKKGKRLSMRTAEDNFQKLVKKDGEFVMPHPVPHTLRHCFASHFLETEKDVVILKAMLGHALMRSTEIYLHPSMDLLSKSAGNHIAAELISNIRAERTWIRGVQKTSGG